jgi:arylsulfatase A-like enzyme
VAISRRDLLLAPAALYAAQPSRPNIITILLDDQRWDAFSAYGKPVHTPH